MVFTKCGHAHCLSDSETTIEVTVFWPRGGRATFASERAAIDSDADVAVLRFAAPDFQLSCARVLPSEEALQVGETTYVVGCPPGGTPLLRYGGMAAGVGWSRPNRWITTALPIPGYSGGGVFVVRNGHYYLAGILETVIIYPEPFGPFAAEAIVLDRFAAVTDE